MPPRPAPISVKPRGGPGALAASWVSAPCARGVRRMSQIVAVIPARFGSTRLPGKPLLADTGRPLIQHVVEAARRATRLDRILVATDDERIARAVEAFGGEAVSAMIGTPAVRGSPLIFLATLSGSSPGMTMSITTASGRTVARICRAAAASSASRTS